MPMHNFRRVFKVFGVWRPLEEACHVITWGTVIAQDEGPREWRVVFEAPYSSLSNFPTSHSHSRKPQTKGIWLERNLCKFSWERQRTWQSAEEGVLTGVSEPKPDSPISNSPDTSSLGTFNKASRIEIRTISINALKICHPQERHTWALC